MRSRLIALVAVAVMLAIGAGALYTRLDDGASGTEDSAVDQINRKRILHNQPTLPADYLLNETPPPTSTASPLGASQQSFAPPPCGRGGITGGEEIVAQYGEVRRGCERFGNLLLFTTLGVGDGRGGIGIFECAEGDTSCLTGEAPATGGPWVFYPAPRPGGVTTLALPSPNILIVSNGGGQMCFNLLTREYIVGRSCLGLE